MPVRVVDAPAEGLPYCQWGRRRTRRHFYGHGTGMTRAQAFAAAAAQGRSIRLRQLQQEGWARGMKLDARRNRGPYQGRQPRFSDRVTLEHDRLLRSQVELAQRLLMDLAGPAIREFDRERQGQRQDATSLFSVLDVLRAIRDAVVGGASSAAQGLLFLAGEVDEDTTDAVDKELSRLLTIPLASAAGADGLIETWVADNVSLITSLGSDVLDEVEALVLNAATGGQPTLSLLDDIQARFGVSYSRASLIARDQTAKLSSQITQARHTAYGIEEYQWSTSGDARVRQKHASLDGRIFTWAEGAPGGIHPGTDFQCLPGDAPVGRLHDVRVAYRRRYRGELTTLVTASGVVLRSTPNHPVLTDRGWVPAHLVSVGDHVFHVGEQCADFGKLDVENGQATAQQVFDALALAGDPQRVAGEAAQFHRDGSQEEVDVVHVDGGLGDEGDPALSQDGAKLFLSVADAAALGTGQGPTVGRAAHASPNRLVRGLRESLALLGRGSLHTDPHRSAASAWLDALSVQVGSDAAAGDVVVLCQRLRALAVQVAPDHRVNRVLLGVWRRATQPTDVHAGGPHGDGEVVTGSANALGDLHEGEPLLSQPMRVVEVGGCVDWSGHVYNFSTERQWYTSSNLIVHNCRCVARPVLTGDDKDVLRAQAVARQQAELAVMQASPTVQGEIPNYSGFSDWNAARIEQLRLGNPAAAGLDVPRSIQETIMPTASTVSAPAWKPLTTGGYSLSGTAWEGSTLARRGRSWILTTPSGAEVDLGTKASFTAAEEALQKL